LNAADGQTHIVPNGVFQANGLTNLSTQGIRRISLVFPISYSSDIDQAKEIVARILAGDERVLQEPAAGISVGELAGDSVNLSALPFVKAGDFAAVQADTVEQVKKEFDAAGIVIPNAQHDVYLYSQN
jgi:small conductance mechanosensitive channel